MPMGSLLDPILFDALINDPFHISTDFRGYKVAKQQSPKKAYTHFMETAQNSQMALCGQILPNIILVLIKMTSGNHYLYQN